jgi:protein FAM32A
MSEYDFVAKGALKLKGVAADSGIKKKKKKSKDKKKDLEEAIAATTSEAPDQGSSSSQGSSDKSSYNNQKTKAEIAFLKKKEERDVQRIREKASVTHKERVEKYNEHLNSLSEHYEPAKVSWTK